MTMQLVMLILYTHIVALIFRQVLVDLSEVMQQGQPALLRKLHPHMQLVKLVVQLLLVG